MVRPVPVRQPSTPGPRPFGDPQVVRDLLDHIAAGEPFGCLKPYLLAPLLLGGRVPAPPHLLLQTRKTERATDVTMVLLLDQYVSTAGSSTSRADGITPRASSRPPG